MQVASSQLPRCYLVTRHPGAIKWLEHKGIRAECVEHFDPAVLRPGDVVIGILPVHLVAETCKRGASYLHLAVDVPRQMRGKEIPADMLDRFNARLVSYQCSESDINDPHFAGAFS